MSVVLLKSPYPDTPPVATTAVAGVPGTFTPAGAPTPATGAAIATLTASPATAWTVGQYVQAANGEQRFWNSSSWSPGIAPVPTGLILGYYFTEGSGTSVDDISTSNRNLNVQTADWATHGLTYVSASSDYSNTVAYSDTVWLSSISVMMAVRFADGGHFHALLNKTLDAGLTNNPIEFYTTSAATPVLAAVRANATVDRRWSGPSVAVGTWAVVSVSWGTNMQTAPTFYLNTAATTGVALSGSANGAPTGSATAVTIGKRINATAFLNGYLGAALVYSRNINATEIGQNYNVLKTLMAQRGVSLP